MTSTSAFFSGDEAVIQRQVTVTSSAVTDRERLRDVYEVDRCVRWIKQGNYNMIALQFPDELMCDAVDVAAFLEKGVDGRQVFILGDTSYGSCCVDEIAAEHSNADCVIHYGRSCLSPTQRLPVLYVFGCAEIDVTDCVEQFQQLFNDRDSRVFVVYDTAYLHSVGKLASVLEKQYQNLMVSTLDIPNCPHTNLPQPDSCQDLGQAREIVTKCGRTFTLPRKTEMEDFSMFYIGCESLTLTNLMMTFNKNSFYSYNPSERLGRRETANVNRMLMKRFYMIEKCKDAHIVGIVVGTLGVADYLKIIDRLKLLIKKTGKKSYTFVVGKLNVAKLANFMEVDVFVLVACPENSLLDSSDFYKPVVTPYELEMACNTSREWSGDFVTDFRQLLPGGADYVVMPDKIDHETDVSLITGKIRNLGETEQQDSDTTSVVIRNQNMAVSEVPADSAGEFLASRSWRGLEQQLGETPVLTAVEGSKGIAMSYTHETDQS